MGRDSWLSHSPAAVAAAMRRKRRLGVKTTIGQRPVDTRWRMRRQPAGLPEKPGMIEGIAKEGRVLYDGNEDLESLYSSLMIAGYVATAISIFVVAAISKWNRIRASKRSRRMKAKPGKKQAGNDPLQIQIQTSRSLLVELNAASEAKLGRGATFQTDRRTSTVKAQALQVKA